MIVVLCCVILTGSFFLDGAAERFKGVIRTSGLTIPMKTITIFGHLGVLVAGVACAYITGLHPATERRRRTAILAGLALLMTGVCVLVLKLLTARGNDGEFYFFWAWSPRAMMFPSGHAAMACAVSVVFGHMYRPLRWPLFVVVVGVAISRIYLSHFLSDVVAGLLVGLVCSSVTIIIGRTFWPQNFAR